MGNTSKAIRAERDRRIAAVEELRQSAKAHPSMEAREAVRRASAELSAWIALNDPPKRGNFACRAGKRQHAEMRAMTAGRRR